MQPGAAAWAAWACCIELHGLPGLQELQELQELLHRAAWAAACSAGAAAPGCMGCRRNAGPRCLPIKVPPIKFHPAPRSRTAQPWCVAWHECLRGRHCRRQLRQGLRTKSQKGPANSCARCSETVPVPTVPTVPTVPVETVPTGTVRLSDTLGAALSGVEADVELSLQQGGLFELAPPPPRGRKGRGEPWRLSGHLPGDVPRFPVITGGR